MPMQITYGQFNPEPGEGLLAPVNFPSLATLDIETGDGRLIVGEGFSSRTLPRSIMAQFATSSGHHGAVVVGTLQEVTVEADGNVSGRGWLVDTTEARHLALLNRTGALTGNSIDMAEVEVELEWKSDDPQSPDFWEYTLRFTKSKLAATTFVNVPAFADASGEVGELVASLRPTDVAITFNFTEHEYVIEMNEDELTADGAPTVPFADFHRPEPRQLQGLRIDEHGGVTFHLAAWGACHRGFDDRCVLAPRPHSYASFHASSVLTDRGLVETGPVFFLGGHPDKPLGSSDPWAAYGGIENAWCDVRLVNGVHGPWASGRVRPGVTPEAIYAARASRLSGHWKGQDVMAIVSVNVPGYNVPGSTLSADRDGARVENGELVELVASVGRIKDEPEQDPEEIRKRLAAQIAAKLVGTTQTMTVCAPATTGTLSGITSMTVELLDQTEESPDLVTDFTDFDNETEILALEMALADDD